MDLYPTPPPYLANFAFKASFPQICHLLVFLHPVPMFPCTDPISPVGQGCPCFPELGWGGEEEVLCSSSPLVPKQILRSGGTNCMPAKRRPGHPLMDLSEPCYGTTAGLGCSGFRGFRISFFLEYDHGSRLF